MRYNIRNLIIKLCCFFILFYIFNISIVGKIFFTEEIATMTLLLPVLILVFLGKIIKMRKIQILVLCVVFIAMIFSLVNNYYIVESRMGAVVKYVVMLLLPFVIVINEKVVDIFIKLIDLFCKEHIIGTFFVQLFNDFYLNVMLPWMSNGGEWVARSNILNGYNPGLTSNYSMNGMYLSIAIIYYFSFFISQKEKKYIINAFFSIVAMLLTAKRGPLVFSIITCIIIYCICNKDKIKVKIFNSIMFCFGTIIVFFILSMIVPQTLTVIDRFIDSYEEGNMLNGRDELYELAIDLWKDNVWLGNGWGAFSYYFQMYLYTDNYLVEYIDAHNVYLQLLCETGIVGTFFYVGIMLICLVLSIKCINKTDKKSLEFTNLCFALGFQVFFLLYCFTGNPLYDIQCYAIYFICIGIVIYNNYLNKLKDKKYE